MRKLIMKMSISLDGFVCGANGEMDWLFKTGDEESKAWVVGICQEAGIHIMGRKTFQNMSSFWPTATGPFAAPMNEIPKAVFTQKGYKGLGSVNSSSPAVASWVDARIFSGDFVEGIKSLKSEPGKPILAHGGAGFMKSLIASGLIDEYYLPVHPVVLGAGMPIFNGLAKTHYLKLMDVKVFPNGVVGHTFHPL